MPPPTEELCDYKNVDVTSIRNSLLSINWERTIRQKNVNNQVEFLTDSIENICSNYCPHRIVVCRHKDAPWMTNEIKCKLKEKTKIYRNFVKKQIPLWTETSNLILSAKQKYYKNEGVKLLDSSLGPKNTGLF